MTALFASTDNQLGEGEVHSKLGLFQKDLILFSYLRVLGNAWCNG